MKFVMSYSCGKDSTLALYKMIEQGNEPVVLVVDGPVFKSLLPYQTGGILDFGDFSIIDVYINERKGHKNDNF